MVLRADSVAEMNCFTALLTSLEETDSDLTFSISPSIASRAASNLSASAMALAEESRQSGAVSPGVNVMHEALPLAHLLEQARAASAPSSTASTSSAGTSGWRTSGMCHAK